MYNIVGTWTSKRTEAQTYWLMYHFDNLGQYKYADYLRKCSFGEYKISGDKIITDDGDTFNITLAGHALFFKNSETISIPDWGRDFKRASKEDMWLLLDIFKAYMARQSAPENIAKTYYESIELELRGQLK